MASETVPPQAVEAENNTETQNAAKVEEGSDKTIPPPEEVAAFLPKVVSEGGWEKCWIDEITPWDLGRTTPLVQHLVDANSIPKGRGLVPGCGAGYDVAAMANPERFVVGLDISENALRKATQKHGTQQNAEYFSFVKEDVFTWRPQDRFDFIFDYVFFCAIEPKERSAWGKSMYELLKPDGELITLMYPVSKSSLTNISVCVYVLCVYICVLHLCYLYPVSNSSKCLLHLRFMRLYFAFTNTLWTVTLECVAFRCIGSVFSFMSAFALSFTFCVCVYVFVFAFAFIFEFVFMFAFTFAFLLMFAFTFVIMFAVTYFQLLYSLAFVYLRSCKLQNSVPQNTLMFVLYGRFLSSRVALRTKYPLPSKKTSLNDFFCFHFSFKFDLNSIFFSSITYSDKIWFGFAPAMKKLWFRWVLRRCPLRTTSLLLGLARE